MESNQRDLESDSLDLEGDVPGQNSDYHIAPGQAAPPATPPIRAGCLHNALFALASLSVLAVTFGIQVGTWVVGQVMLVEEEPMPGTTWLLVTWAQSLLLLVPLVPLALLTRPPRLRAAYRTWALASAFLLPFGLVRLVPYMRTEAASLAQAVAAAVALAITYYLTRRRNYRVGRLSGSLLSPTLVLAAVIAAPWAAFGALGSPLDTLLSIAAGLAFAAVAALLLEAFLLAPLRQTEGRYTLFGGFVAGVTLSILGSGFGFGGNQLMLMIVLPSLGFALAALARTGNSEVDAPVGRWVPALIVLAVVTSSILAFFDPKELTLLLDQGFEGDIPTWATVASLASVLLAWLAGIIARVASRRPARTTGGGAVPRLSAGGAWVALLLVYFAAGQPGFHGDGLFVVLKDQADLSAAANVADRNQRTAFVFQTLTSHAETTQMNLRSDLDRLRIPYQPYYLVNGIVVDGGPLVRLYLSGRPEVDRILDNPRLRPLPRKVPESKGDRNAPSSPDWNITSIGADRVWRELGVTGKGIVVGQSDSGVDGSHPALKDGYRGRNGDDRYNWLDPWNHTPSPVDTGGHGTHTLGSVLGRGGIGVAPDAEWFACVNLDRNLGNPGLYLDCMQYMLAPYPQGGNPFADGDPTRAAHVTNNSWGCPEEEGCDATALLPAAHALRAAGIFMAVSAGNSGPRCESLLDPLAIYQDVFTVGAIDPKGSVTDFSSRGPVYVDGSGRIKPDIIAPGEEVLSSFPDGTYKSLQGTSMAGPHVAGVVALMWSAQPRLIGDIDRTEQILRDTAKPYSGRRVGCFQVGNPSPTYGYGVLDAYAAVKAAMEIK